jgi:predicted nucleic acid-binding protein
MSGIEYLLDTNVVLGLLKGHPPAVALVQRSGMSLQRSAVSQITRMELLGFPGLQAEEEAVISAFLQTCHVSLLDTSVEKVAIALRRRAGLKLPDSIVAATALTHGWQLLTLDEKLADRWNKAKQVS